MTKYTAIVPFGKHSHKEVETESGSAAQAMNWLEQVYGRGNVSSINEVQEQPRGSRSIGLLGSVAQILTIVEIISNLRKTSTIVPSPTQGPTPTRSRPNLRVVQNDQIQEIVPPQVLSKPVELICKIVGTIIGFSIVAVPTAVLVWIIIHFN
jgi:hypothetical protein